MIYPSRWEEVSFQYNGEAHKVGATVWKNVGQYVEVTFEPKDSLFADVLGLNARHLTIQIKPKTPFNSVDNYDGIAYSQQQRTLLESFYNAIQKAFYP